MVNDEPPGMGGYGRSTGPLYEPCQEAIATLYTFLDGELTPGRRELIQHHLDECGPCFEKFGFEAELKHVIARKCRDEVPQSLRQRVAEALKAEGATT
jgi:mycothiol system anti-sigma-R factor